MASTGVIEMTPTGAGRGRRWPAAWIPLDDLSRDDVLTALCAQTDPETFFPPKGHSSQAAKRVCASCPIRSRCLQVAMANPDLDGIWGGTTPGERRRLRAAHAGEASAA